MHCLIFKGSTSPTVWFWESFVTFLSICFPISVAIFRNSVFNHSGHHFWGLPILMIMMKIIYKLSVYGRSCVKNFINFISVDIHKYQWDRHGINTMPIPLIFVDVMGSQRGGYDWATELNWTELINVPRSRLPLVRHFLIEFSISSTKGDRVYSPFLESGLIFINPFGH